MKKLAAAAAVSLMVSGCAHAPFMKQQVNQPAKADKYAAPIKAAPATVPTPNEIVKKRWYDRFKVHPKWFSSK